MRTILKILFISMILTALAVPYSCAQKSDDPEENFEFLWSTFDKTYAIFPNKRIDWTLLYKVYRPKVNAETNDDELFKIMSDMLNHLDDGHVRLDSSDPERSFRSGKDNTELTRRFGSFEQFLNFFRKRPILDKYRVGTLSECHSGIFVYTWLENQVGYFHFNKFQGIDESSEAIDSILEYFNSAKAIVIDIRRNGGGYDEVGNTIANRFADKKRHYMTTRLRNGPDHDDYDKAVKWYVEPKGTYSFTKPVVVLMDEFSGSAAENFALAMRVLPNTILVGDYTAGSFADYDAHRMPNGWLFAVSINLFEDHNGFCWEGIGIPPDYRIINTDLDWEGEHDKQLEFALDLIEALTK